MFSVVADFQRLISAPLNLNFLPEPMYETIMSGFSQKLFNYALKLSKYPTNVDQVNLLLNFEKDKAKIILNQPITNLETFSELFWT
jgi:hypothetical protein